MAAATSTLAAIAIAGALGYGAKKNSSAPKLPAPSVLPPLPVAPDPTLAATQAAARQKRRTIGAGGRSSTLLTGPSGITQPAAPAKTLLGS